MPKLAKNAEIQQLPFEMSKTNLYNYILGRDKK